MIKVGIVGTGGIAEWHASAFKDNKDVQRVIKNSIHWVCPEKTSGLWIDRIAKGIDNMERKDPVQPIEVKGYQVDHNYKK